MPGQNISTSMLAAQTALGLCMCLGIIIIAGSLFIKRMITSWTAALSSIAGPHTMLVPSTGLKVGSAEALLLQGPYRHTDTRLWLLAPVVLQPCAQGTLPLFPRLPSLSFQEEIPGKLFLWSLISLGTKSIKIFLILTHAILNVWGTGRNR